MRISHFIRVAGLAGVVGLAGLSACSEPDGAPTEQGAETANKVDLAAIKPARVAIGDGILSEAFDATLSAEDLTAACEVSFAKLSDEYEALRTYEGPATLETVARPFNLMGEGPGVSAGWAYLMGNVHPDPEVREAANACVQKFVALSTEIGLDKSIYDLFVQIDITDADSAARQYVEDTIRDFENSGVNRDEETRTKIKELIQFAYLQSQEFAKNIREDVRYVEVTDPAQLAGLPDDFIANHPADENGIIRLSTNYPDYFPVMTYADDDELRKSMRTAYGGRAYPANEQVLHDLLKARYDMAQILGYETYADLAMEDRMIGTPEHAGSFVDEISAIVKPAAEVEKARLLRRYQQIDPDATQVMPWQRGYVSEIIRREQYEVDAKEVRQYFRFDEVQKGIFQLVEDLFEVEIRPWETSVWDPSVESFEVVLDGAVIGRFYLDMHPRPGKYNHAAHFRLRSGVREYQIPMGALICNFPGGDGSQGLMSHGDVETFLHEFGHLMHNVLSGTYDWFGVSGMSMEHDFVEAPSQMLEEWVWDYETLSKFATNEAGEVLPAELFERMKAARDFGVATSTAGQTFLAAVSLNFYNRDPETFDFIELQKELYAKYSVYDYVGGTYLFANFGHLSNYSSNYYTYQWSLAIAADMFTEFEKNGLRDKETALRYRDLVLGAAGGKPAEEFVADFLGRPWSLDAYRDKLNRAAAAE